VRIQQHTIVGTTADLPQAVPQQADRWRLVALTAAILFGPTPGLRKVFLEISYAGVILIARIPIKTSAPLNATAELQLNLSVGIDTAADDDGTSIFWTAQPLPDLVLDSRCEARLVVYGGLAEDQWGEVSWLLDK